ncbi:hypothetical protein TVAG_261220 [Trichomonas vaginalis G3]|uniref:Uncharacterized protein n=1 Tax=Trichomonas vaginalis (strain ATCC PRA-98 / G3) TaxID=412133 RepID=A2G183_TRIV3|nr:hypothetical protein TVAGG3_0559330 [Trichomonas vaginalis G3]EAX89077.1 hypothetical protein TVAG_261220 [Trichomonas vaginalis G3]KAI5521072.1 hypothetical protein TVAGG3_0559330 [Trichomonas vaginalis G3]|eukprot:XP_001302007.1 hypothetical protein [Trichomonas vaginalis G3]
MAFRCKDKKSVNLVAEKLINSLAIFHTHAEGDEFVFKKRDVPIYTIPKSITSLRDQAYFVDDNFAKMPDVNLGTIAISDDSVVVSGSHALYDGGTIVDICKSLSHNLDLPELKLPYSSFDPFLKEMEKAPGKMAGFNADANISYFQSKDNLYKGSRATCDNITSHIYEDEFICYNKKDNKLHGLSENYFSAITLALNALNGKFNKAGLWEVVGTRPYSEKGFDVRQGQFMVSIPVYSDVNENSTVGEMKLKFRRDFDLKMKEKLYFSSLKCSKDGYLNLPPFKGDPPMFSMIGNFECKGPISDIHVSLGSAGEFPFGHVPFITYSVDSGNGRKRFDIQNLVSRRILSIREAQSVGELTVTALKYIKDEMKVGEAIEVLKKKKNEVFNRLSSIDRVIRF